MILNKRWNGNELMKDGFVMFRVSLGVQLPALAVGGRREISSMGERCRKEPGLAGAGGPGAGGSQVPRRRWRTTC